uniref:Uncharacterized protein n=1 Tax=Urocitellus parryii TaxID=9999 RepID=A0A8D2H1Y9_UROPR
ICPVSGHGFVGNGQAPCGKGGLAGAPGWGDDSQVTPGRPAEHYREMKGKERKTQMWAPVNSLISQSQLDPEQSQARSLRNLDCAGCCVWTSADSGRGNLPSSQ